GRIGIHFVFGKGALAALFVAKKREKESIVRGVDEVAAVFLFLGVFFQRLPLGSGVVDQQRQRPRQVLQVGAIRGGVLGFAIGAEGDPDHPRPRRNDPRNFYR